MKIIELEEVDSTHSYLQELIKTTGYSQPTFVIASYQTKGIGSRGNFWKATKDNLFFSFVVRKDDLPKDLPLQSVSIYYSFLLKIILNENGSKVWLKWPNDFYISNKKVRALMKAMTY